MNSKSEKQMTIHDVAKALGVSTSTVSRAISGKGRIGEETRKRVLEFIEKNDYHPNGIAQSLAKSRSENIAIIIPEVKELVDLPFFYTCMYGVNEVALANGYDMLVVTTNGKDTTHLKKLIDNHKVDGMILGRTYRNDVFAKFLKENGMPFVAIGALQDEDMIQVDHDNQSACCDLTAILLSRKWRKIAYIGNVQGPIVNENRFAGYMQAYEEAGIPIDWGIVSRNNATETAMRQKVGELLRKDVDCILCQDDSVCNIVLQELHDRGVKIPKDMRVASCHNSKILDNYPVSVTSLRFDIVELGRVACKTLLDVLNGKNVLHRTLLDYEVVLKESTGR